MGIAPDELPLGSYKVLTARGQGGLPLTVSKDDVAKLLLAEAVSPQYHKVAVTVGKDKNARVV